MPDRVATFSLRLELLNQLDQQIEILATKTFAAFTNEEMGLFRSREKRIRELEQLIASVPVRDFSQVEALSLSSRSSGEAGKSLSASNLIS